MLDTNTCKSFHTHLNDYGKHVSKSSDWLSSEIGSKLDLSNQSKTVTKVLENKD